MNPYHILYFFLYKFIKITTKQSLQNHVKPSTDALFFICLFHNFNMILILSHSIKYLPSLKLFFVLTYLVPAISLYYFNKRHFSTSDRYLRIETKYDSKFKLSKVSFIAIATSYIFLSIAGMLIAGIYYSLL